MMKHSVYITNVIYMNRKIKNKIPYRIDYTIKTEDTLKERELENH